MRDFEGGWTSASLVPARGTYKHGNIFFLFVVVTQVYFVPHFFFTARTPPSLIGGRKHRQQMELRADPLRLVGIGPTAVVTGGKSLGIASVRVPIAFAAGGQPGEGICGRTETTLLGGDALVGTVVAAAFLGPFFVGRIRRRLHNNKKYNRVSFFILCQFSASK